MVPLNINHHIILDPFPVSSAVVAAAFAAAAWAAGLTVGYLLGRRR